MLSPRWRKVLRDLWYNKTRTILVVFSIAIGVFAVGMVLHTNLLVAERVRDDFVAARPANATFYAENITDEMVARVSKMGGVAAAEGRSSVQVQVQISDGEWAPLELTAFPEPENLLIDRVLPINTFREFPDVGAERGIWPPGRREVVIERSSYFNQGMIPPDMVVGDKLTFKTSDEKIKILTVVGLAHESNRAPAPFNGQGFGYVDIETLEWLGGSSTYDQLNIRVTGDDMDEEHITAVAEEVEEKLSKSGRTVYFTEVHTPGRSPRDDILEGFTAIMFPMGIMSLLLSGFLVVNIISALLSQHIRQIGMMKAVGARNDQITQMYMGMIFLFGILSLLVAVPLAALATVQTARLLSSFLNVTFTEYTLPWPVLGVEVLIGLVAPFLAALIPVWRGTRTTVREAISDYGVGKGVFGSSLFDRALTHIRHMSRPNIISIRNTFRRRGRLILTLITLVMSGAIFIAVTNVHGSLLRTLDFALQYWAFDTQVSFNRGYRVDQIEGVAYTIPGVKDVESWGFASLRIKHDNETESEGIFVRAVPANTQMLQPILIEGRWLVEGDESALVINQALREDENLTLGDTLIMEVEGKEREWTVVGTVQILGNEPQAFVNYPYYMRISGNVGRAGQVQIITEQNDSDFVNGVTEQLQEAYERAGMGVEGTMTVNEIREGPTFFFGVIVTLLLVMTVLIASVGALGLAGTMSVNVLERTREIGVLRAIGASNMAVRKIILIEGILIGFISWVVGALLALPLGRLMSDGIGYAMFEIPLNYAFSPNGIGLWLLIVLVLATLASLLPAHNASRMTVRETLAYQ
ncbi:MAG: FtsX-like permease family protein [Chloroflexota bacterium]